MRPSAALKADATPSRVEAFDARVDDVFARLRGNPIADRVFYSASALGDFGLLWLALGLLRILRGRPGDTRGIASDHRHWDRIGCRQRRAEITVQEKAPQASGGASAPLPPTDHFEFSERPRNRSLLRGHVAR